MRIVSSLALVVFTMTSACTTLFKKEEEHAIEREDGRRALAVVMQPGKDRAAYSPVDRNYWVKLRSESKDDVKRMYAALASGESEAAGELARAYLRKHPGHRDGLLVLAGSLSLEKNYDLAAFYAEQLLEKEPDHPTALNILGMQALFSPKNRMEDFRLAAQYFERAFQNSDEIAAGMNLGNLQLELGNAQRAETVFREVASRCDNCVDGLMGYGISSSRAGRYTQAVEIFERVLKVHSNHSGALYHLALVHENGLKDRQAAIKNLEKLLADSQTDDTFVKERAQSTLRKIKSEKPYEPSQEFIADEDSADKETGETSSKAEVRPAVEELGEGE